ncbi:hypothetical protein ACSGGA_24830 [Salmonella enterica]
MLNNEFRKLGESVSEAVTSNETKNQKNTIALLASTDREIAGKTPERVKRAMMQHRKRTC